MIAIVTLGYDEAPVFVDCHHKQEAISKLGKRAKIHGFCKSVEIYTHPNDEPTEVIPIAIAVARVGDRGAR